MATQLGVYRDALRHLGEIRLANLTDDVEARYALDDAWDDAIINLLRQAAWRFALTTETVTQDGSGVAGFDYTFTRPDDWLRTHAIFVTVGTAERPVDVREQGGVWYSSISPMTVRYVSKDGRNPSLWPEQFASALAAYLAFLVCERLTGDAERVARTAEVYDAELRQAVERDAIPEDEWLRHQLSGSMAEGARFLLGKGQWRFSLRTVTLSANAETPSAGYGYAFDQPDDMLRPVWFYQQFGHARRDVEYRSEDGQLHADIEEPVLRYVSTALGLDSTLWTDGFMSALQSYLGMKEALATPDVPGAVLQARQQAYERMMRQAEIQDDALERPRVDRVGRFVAARGGYMNREHGY